MLVRVVLRKAAEFGDIFSQTPLQTNGVGTGSMTKSVKQQFSQGNISQSTNTLDMAISGQGFFALQGGGNAGQTVYTRNGAFSVNDDGFIVDSNGQFLLGYPVDTAVLYLIKHLKVQQKCRSLPILVSRKLRKTF